MVYDDARLMLSMRSRSCPAGTVTSMTSPTFRLRSACPIGDLIEILPSRRFASWGLAMTYVMLLLLAKLVIPTRLSNPTLSLLSREVSITRANFSTLCLNRILPSKRDCSRLAAWYSKFSLRSPLSRASAIASLTLGSSTLSI